MPRGKNYVNHNKGVTLEVHKKKNPKMEQCFYGSSCTRKDCIYRHDGAGMNNGGDAQQSKEPCMAYLTGSCVFNAQTCRKRHPPKAEVEQLIAKYQTIPCRNGENCKIKGCLYFHTPQGPDRNAFPPLPTNPTPVLATSAWRPALPGAAVSRKSTNDAHLNIHAKEFVPSFQN